MSTPKKKIQYDCSKCTGYCCSYDHIEVTESDIARLAKHFKLTLNTAREKFINKCEKKETSIFPICFHEHLLDSRPCCCRQIRIVCNIMLPLTS